MNKKTVLITISFNIASCIFLIFHLYKAILLHNLGVIAILVALLIAVCMLLLKAFSDYKYLNGSLSYNEFKKRPEYEYWFLLYGDKAYVEYLKERLK